MEAWQKFKSFLEKTSPYREHIKRYLNVKIISKCQRIDILMGVFVVFFLFLLFRGPDKDQSLQSPETLASQEDLIKAKAEDIPKKILRIERKAPQEDYPESIIFINKKEVARFKTKKGRVVDLKGRIPEGKVQFVNEWENTHGVESYYRKKRDGEYIEYYRNGQVKIEAEYHRGKLVKRKSYFVDGVLRVEEDCASATFLAMLLPTGKIKNAGIGKMYRSDGTLKYEWYMVDGAKKNFDKTYNKDEDMIEANYYNGEGEFLEQWQVPSD